MSDDVLQALESISLRKKGRANVSTPSAVSTTVSVRDQKYKIRYLGPEDEKARVFKSLESKETLEEKVMRDTTCRSHMRTLCSGIVGIGFIDALEILMDASLSIFNNECQVKLYLTETQARVNEVQQLLLFKNIRKDMTEWKSRKMAELDPRKEDGVIVIQDVVSRISSRINTINAEYQRNSEEARLKYQKEMSALNEKKQKDIGEIGKVQALMVMQKPFRSQTEATKKSALNAFDKERIKNKDIRFDDFCENWWQDNQASFMAKEIEKLLMDEVTASFLTRDESSLPPQ